MTTWEIILLIIQWIIHLFFAGAAGWYFSRYRELKQEIKCLNKILKYREEDMTFLWGKLQENDKRNMENFIKENDILIEKMKNCSPS